MMTQSFIDKIEQRATDLKRFGNHVSETRSAFISRQVDQINDWLDQTGIPSGSVQYQDLEQLVENPPDPDSAEEDCITFSITVNTHTVDLRTNCFIHWNSLKEAWVLKEWVVGLSGDYEYSEETNDLSLRFLKDDACLKFLKDQRSILRSPQQLENALLDEFAKQWQEGFCRRITPNNEL